MSQVHAHTDGATLHLSLAGTLTIAEAAETRIDLLTHLAAAAPELREVSLDLSAVPEIDTAGIQLLMSTARTLLTQGRQATLQRHSDVVRTVSLALGAADTRQCCGFALPGATGALT
jgi:anti-sigma B factor antagonist